MGNEQNNQRVSQRLEDFFDEMDSLVHLSASQWKLFFDVQALLTLRRNG